MKRFTSSKSLFVFMTLLILASFTICYAGGGSFGGGTSGDGSGGGSLYGECEKIWNCNCAVKCLECKRCYSANTRGAATNVRGICSCFSTNFLTLYDYEVGGGEGGAN